MTQQAIVYTLGTSTRGSQEFVGLLLANNIDSQRSWVPRSQQEKG